MIFIIAEIGINHNGDIQIAKEMIKAAHECGCNAVKFQKRTINKVYDEDFLKEERVSPFGKTQRDQKEGIELKENDYIEIDRYCNELGIPWFASCWDIDSFTFLNKFDLQYNKVSSPMLTHDELLHLIAKKKKYTFISTGMSNKSIIDNVVKIFNEYECPFELMHCVSIYPCEVETINLSKIKTLQETYSCDVGFSDHCQCNLFSFASCSLGITSLERHFTLDKFMYGSDQKASVNKKEMFELVKGVRELEKAIGKGELEVNPGEIDNMKKLRAKFV